MSAAPPDHGELLFKGWPVNGMALSLYSKGILRTDGTGAPRLLRRSPDLVETINRELEEIERRGAGPLDGFRCTSALRDWL